MTAYSGYYRREVPDEDPELTHVGPGTPCGEYLRRFWHPVGLSSELADLPRAARILGEDLVLFRNGQGQVGLLAMHCSHRGASLEFGTIERHGLRCCYHGWMYGVDGRVLDTPGEPAEATIQGRLYHGAYPTYEYKGLVFAYMGPPDKRPEFPVFERVTGSRTRRTTQTRSISAIAPSPSARRSLRVSGLHPTQHRSDPAQLAPLGRDARARIRSAPDHDVDGAGG